jgi:hypothetical protein
LIKLDLPNQLLAEWFTKSFMNKISRDISMGRVFTKEQAINHTQYLYLVYSQTSTHYDLLLDAPHPSTTTMSTTPAASHVADGVIDTFYAQPQSMQASPTNPKSNASNVQNDPTHTSSIDKTSKVNSVQSTPVGKNKSKKGKG